VLEGGQARPLLDVRVETDGPVRLAVLMDVSGSMRIAGRFVDAGLAARQVFAALRPQDQAALYAFDTQLERVLDFTSDVSRLEGGLDDVVPPFGQTSLYDAIAETAREIAGHFSITEGPDAAPQRLAIVVLTDGVDTSSRLSPAQVSGVASSIDIPVYVLAIMPAIDDPRHQAIGPAAVSASELGSLSRWTGGELFTASTPAHANVAARRIVDELRHQYVLAFEASSEPGWRPVEVRARNRGLVVRARAGYIAGGAGAGFGRTGTSDTRRGGLN
jgi:VWFA-related protein